MKKYYLTLLISLFFVSLNAQQWQYTGGPIGPILVNEMVSVDSVQYAFTPCAGYKRIGQGDWEKVISVGAKDAWVAKDTLFLKLDSPGGFYYMPINASTDPTQWPKAYTNVTDWSGFSDIEVKDALKVFLTPQDGIRYTFGLKNSLQTFDPSLPFDDPLYAVQNIDLEIIGDQVFLLRARGLYASSFQFDRWKAINLSFYHREEAKLYSLNSLMMISDRKKLYLSQDTGQNFNLVHSFPAHIIDVSYHNGFHYVTTEDGPWRSSDNGLNWTAINSGLLNRSSGFLHKVDTNLYFSNGYEHLSKMASNNWRPANVAGMQCVTQPHLASESGELFLSERNWVYTRNPNIGFWNSTLHDDTATMLSVQVIDSLVLVPFKKYSNGNWKNGVHYTSDKGSHWYSFDLPSASASYDPRIVSANGGLFISAGSKLYFTPNFGRSIQNHGPGFGDDINEVYDMEWHGGKLYVTGASRQTIRIKDGINWSHQVNREFTGGRGSQLHKWGSELFYFTGGYIFIGNNLGAFQKLKSTPFAEIQDVITFDENLVVISGYEMYYSRDTGTSWHDISMPGLFPKNLAVTADSLYCATSDGVFSFPVSAFNSIGEKAYDFTTSISLYPNPAHHHIKLMVVGLSPTDYQILSLDGKILYEGPFESEHPMDVGNLRPGIYLLKLKTEKGWSALKFVKQ